MTTDATHVYIATAPCGCVSALMVDIPGREKSTANEVAKLIRRGDVVTRLTLEEARKTSKRFGCEHFPMWKAPKEGATP